MAPESNHPATMANEHTTAPSGGTAIETRSIEYVPQSERYGKAWHLSPIWFMGGAQLATIYVGAVGLAFGGNLIWTIIAAILGVGFGTFFMAFHSAQGPQLGLPQMIQSRPQFGYYGALLIWILAIAAYLGSNIFSQVIGGQVITTLVDVPAPVAGVVFVLVALVVAVFGYAMVHQVQRWLSILTIAVFLVVTVLMVTRLHPAAGQLSLSEFNLTAFIAQFGAAAGYQLSWAIYVSDYSRYLPRNVSVRSTMWWTYIGAAAGGLWFMCVGAWLTATSPIGDPVAALKDGINDLVPGLGTGALIVSLLGLAMIVGLNFYGASLTAISVIDTLRPAHPTRTLRLVVLGVMAVITITVALNLSADFTTKLGSFLTLLLYVLAPWTAINLVDFYLVRRGIYSVRQIFDPSGIYGHFSWRGLGAYAIGIVAMLPFMSVFGWVAPAAKALDGADIAPFVGMILPGLVYLFVSRSIDLVAERAAVAEADEGLETAPLAVH